MAASTETTAKEKKRTLATILPVSLVGTSSAQKKKAASTEMTAAMAKEKKRMQPADAPSPRDGGERKGQNEKKPKKEKAAPALPLQIKNKGKHSEVHAKLKREKKSHKRKLAREREQAAQRAAEVRGGHLAQFGERRCARPTRHAMSPMRFFLLCLGWLRRQGSTSRWLGMLISLTLLSCGNCTRWRAICGDAWMQVVFNVNQTIRHGS